MSAINATITDVREHGKSCTVSFKYAVGGEEKTASAKAWADAGHAVGQSKPIEIESKQKYNAPEGEMEKWIKAPPKGGGGFKGGGGGGKADPEKLAIERERLNLEREKNADIRGMVDKKDCSIISQVILKLSVESILHETKAGSAINPDAVEILADQYAQIFHKIQARVGAQ